VLRLQEEWQSRSLDLDKAKQDLEEQRGRLAADRKAVLWNRNRRNRLTEPEPQLIKKSDQGPLLITVSEPELDIKLSDFIHLKKIFFHILQ
jgi:hypothetical protein